MMDARTFLDQYWEAHKRAVRLEFEYAKEQIMIDAVRSTLGTDGTPHGSGVSKSVEDRAVRLADKAAEWKMAQLDALEMRQRVFDLIWDIPGEPGEILCKRYIDLLEWSDICRRLHMSRSTANRQHKKGLEEVERRLTGK